MQQLPGGCPKPKTDFQFEVLHEQAMHRRYLTLYNRRIRFPPSNNLQGAEFEFDVVGHPQCDFHFSLTFPFHRSPHSKTGEVTLLREHCQGPNQMMFTLPTGGFSPAKHGDWLQCAKSELSEEAHLQGGDWHALLPEGHPGIAEVKWCANRFTPFLCINPEVDGKPASRDAEEFIEVHRMPLDALKDVMMSGEMLLPSLSTCFLAFERLGAMGMLD